MERKSQHVGLDNSAQSLIEKASETNSGNETRTKQTLEKSIVKSPVIESIASSDTHDADSGTSISKRQQIDLAMATFLTQPR